MSAISGPGGQPLTGRPAQATAGTAGATPATTNVGATAPVTPSAPPRPELAPGPAERGALPPAAPTPASPDWTEQVITKVSEGIDALEKEIGTLDLNSADGQKKMLLIQRKMQRLDEMFRLISTMWAMKHDAIKQVFQNMR